MLYVPAYPRKADLAYPSSSLSAAGYLPGFHGLAGQATHDPPLRAVWHLCDRPVDSMVGVEVPIEHVWAFLMDPKNWEEWDPRTTYTDFSGPLDQVGTTFMDTSRLLGFEMKSKDEVVEVEPPRLLHIRSDGPTDMFIRLEAEGGATRAVVEIEYQLPAYLPGFVKKLMTKTWMEGYMRQTLEYFKAHAELKAPVPA